LSVEVSAAAAADLCAAAVRWAFDETGLALSDVEPGALLADGAEALLQAELHDHGLVELDLGRLAPRAPGIAGDGVLARARFLVLRDDLIDLGWGYDLRGSDTAVLARGWSGGPAFGPPGVTASLLLPASPNPARGRTQFAFRLVDRGDVALAVFDASGRGVRDLYHREQCRDRTLPRHLGRYRRPRPPPAGGLVLHATGSGELVSIPAGDLDSLGRYLPQGRIRGPGTYEACPATLLATIASVGRREGP
jgi:hypothetical protein